MQTTGTSAQGPASAELAIFEVDDDDEDDDGIEISGEHDIQDDMWEVKFEDIKFIKVIGEGRSGKMYLATLNGTEVAAKRMEIKPPKGREHAGGGGRSAFQSVSLSVTPFQAGLVLACHVDMCEFHYSIPYICVIIGCATDLFPSSCQRL
jgi:hypothetical protein